jgi:undecaprenyl-diphosphatase
LAVVFLYKDKFFKSFIYLKNILIAFIPTGVVGFVLYKFIKAFLLGNNLVEILAILIGGLIILFFEYKQKQVSLLQSDFSKQTIEDLSVKNLLLLGVAQAVAVIPGVSRSGAVIVCGRAIKIPTSVITEFSFMLAVPTMLAATLYDIYKSGFNITGAEWATILIGFIVSFVVAIIVVKWLVDYVKNHTFSVFGWYRIVLGIILLFFYFAK